jgi:histidine ammonia-lyase
MIHTISADKINLDSIKIILKPDSKLALSEDAKNRIVKCRTYLDNKLQGNTQAFYGINTGFGSLYDKSISEKDLGQLQVNLVMSHACGMGDEVDSEIVRLMLFLKIQGLSYGNSGVQLETVQLMIEMFNNHILPVVYELGSLGASGDLAPLAHLSLPLIGLGEVRVDGKVYSTMDAFAKFNLKTVELRSKEGLALLNGTQFMSSYGIWCILKSNNLMNAADTIGAISLEGYDGRIEPFHPAIHEIRPHAGQITTAKRFRDLLNGSEIISQSKKHVQDPYAFRCIPQVHGASRDTLDYVTSVFITEINSVTDNPTVFADDDLIISAGNFHGQPLALPLDFLAIAMAEIGSISERRTYQLISGLRGLPAFLVANPGLDSGFMIPQYTAASIVSQNKQLCTPASIDSIVSSNGQEDHVSMGANAATKLWKVVKNVERILAIELMNATQALEFRRPLKSSAAIESLVASYRAKVPFVQKDRIMYTDLDTSVNFIKTTKFS